MVLNVKGLNVSFHHQQKQHNNKYRHKIGILDDVVLPLYGVNVRESERTSQRLCFSAFKHKNASRVCEPQSDYTKNITIFAILLTHTRRQTELRQVFASISISHHSTHTKKLCVYITKDKKMLN